MTDQYDVNAEEPVTGKAAGGKARSESLSPERRSEIARKAAAARRELHSLPRATHGSANRPLSIGNVELVCYVLDDGTRLITQEGFLSALGRARKAKGGHGASGSKNGVDRLPSFLAAKNLKPFISKEIIESTTPVVFRTPSGVKAYGYRADLLPKVCNVYLQARDEDAILPSQSHLVVAADILMRGLAEVGIIALVDEVTGYQKDRARNALAQILESFVAKELQPWVKTFPPEFYEHLFRLRGLSYPPANARYKPQYFGKLTNDIVYRRLAPGVLAELKKQASRGAKAGKLHQRLTRDVGHPKLREHLASVITVMKLTPSGDEAYADFISMLDQVAPRYDDTLPLKLD